MYGEEEFDFTESDKMTDAVIEKGKESLAERAIKTLTWMIRQFDFQTAQMAQDMDEAMGEHLMPNDSPEMTEARLVLADLTSTREALEEVVQDVLKKQAGHTIAPTTCFACVKENNPMCPYNSGGCGRPNPNPCPAFEEKKRADCPRCKGYRDLSDMRHHEYKCLTRNINVTKAKPLFCGSFDPR